MSTPRIVSEFVTVPVDGLVLHPENPNRGDAERLARAMVKSGIFYGSILVQRATGYVIVGNHRLIAARMVGMAEVPVQYADVDDARAMELLIGDNQHARRSRWDDRGLLAALDSLPSVDEAITAFAPLDIELLRRSLDDIDDDPGGDGDGGGRTPAAEVKCQIGSYAFSVSRARYDGWVAKVTTNAGHAADAVVETICERLMI